jgi:DNA-binding FadR family transcriptional regulator
MSGAGTVVSVGVASEVRSGGRAQNAARLIGKRILNGDLVPGDYLMAENEILSELEIGRSTWREASQILSSKGLIASRQRAGTVVCPREDWHVLDPAVITWMSELGGIDEILTELYEYRRSLEPVAARLAAERANEADRASLERAFTRLESALGDREAEVQADIDLHVRVVLAADNRFFIPLATTIKMLLRLGIERAAPAPNPLAPSFLAKSFDLHGHVVEAILARDGSAAEFAMRSIVEQGIRDFRHAKARRQERDEK